ncbi:hypothetical protein ARMGADRAFT_1087683 [Armillaria gallica]|uniref:Protein kinase domain-containing protein n=1 Tax=Armillaria gallica TaxID=47427 RepID=A0A2H3CTP7_ARMGA|nr:hypothetical protein ARMGADRAFT_1087683 [Armillaria gallica]
MAPEHSKPVALFECNLFPTNIYYLGNMLREYFLDTKAHCNPTRIDLDYLWPLVADMVKENPSEWPTIDDVVIQFDKLVKSRSFWHLQAVTQLGNQPFFFLSPTLLDA